MYVVWIFNRINVWVRGLKRFIMNGVVMSQFSRSVDQ